MKFLFSILLILGLSGLSVSAQQQQIRLETGDVDVKKMDKQTQKTPVFRADAVKDKNVPNPRDWLEVEVEFEIDGPSKAVVPELIFRYYIGFRDQNGNPRVLTGDVKHTNMQAKEKYYSAVYVAPNTLGEITGDFRRFQDSAVEAMGVEVIYNGVVVGGKSTQSGSRAKFWQATGTQPGVLPKNETPFALLWIDRYAESEKPR